MGRRPGAGTTALRCRPLAPSTGQGQEVRQAIQEDPKAGSSPLRRCTDRSARRHGAGFVTRATASEPPVSTKLVSLVAGAFSVLCSVSRAPMAASSSVRSRQEEPFVEQAFEGPGAGRQGGAAQGPPWAGPYTYRPGGHSVHPRRRAAMRSSVLGIRSPVPSWVVPSPRPCMVTPINPFRHGVRGSFTGCATGSVA